MGTCCGGTSTTMVTRPISDNSGVDARRRWRGKNPQKAGLLLFVEDTNDKGDPITVGVRFTGDKMEVGLRLWEENPHWKAEELVLG